MAPNGPGPRDHIALQDLALPWLGAPGRAAPLLVHLRTGLPLMTHTPHQGCPSCALEQLDIIEEMGVDPRLTCIGHLADIVDDPGAELHKALARRGAFLGFDTVGHQITQGDAEKVKMIVSCIDAGFEDYVLLSADFAREEELKAKGGAGYSSVVAEPRRAGGG